MNVLWIAFASAALAPYVAMAADPAYRAIDIGFLAGRSYTIPAGLNDGGTVVGSAENGVGIAAFVWTAASGIKKLPVPPGGEKLASLAYDINDAGQIIGAVSSGGPIGNGGNVIWEVDGTFNFFLTNFWPQTQRTYSIPQITNAGRVLGQSYWDYSSGDTTVYPWIWSPERGLFDIVDRGEDGFRAYQMNDSGRVAGSHFNCFTAATAIVFDTEPTRRFRWLDPDYGKTCRSSQATAVNDQGQVVGWAQTYKTGRVLPFLWTEADGWKTLWGSPAPNREQSKPTDINNAGQVVGILKLVNQSSRRSYFYWDEENGFHDLKKLLDPTDPMTAQVVLHLYASGFDPDYIPKINNRGEILVAGSLKGDDSIFLGPKRTFLLVPVRPQTQR
jgi:probable HAF family extracellular repeat protein